jgi:hypothetical protein
MIIIDKAAAAYAAMKARFHGNQVDGEPFKQPPEYHSLWGPHGIGKRDQNGNLLGPDGKVLGRAEALFGTANPINPFTGRRDGDWFRPSGDDWMRRRG